MDRGGDQIDQVQVLFYQVVAFLNELFALVAGVNGDNWSRGMQFHVYNTAARARERAIPTNRRESRLETYLS